MPSLLWSNAEAIHFQCEFLDLQTICFESVMNGRHKVTEVSIKKILNNLSKVGRQPQERTTSR